MRVVLDLDQMMNHEIKLRYRHRAFMVLGKSQDVFVKCEGCVDLVLLLRL